MPILKEMGQLISVASFFRRQIKFLWKLGLKSVPAPEIFLLKITVDIAIVYKVGNTDFFLWRHMWRIFMTPFFRQFILIFIENDAIYFTSPLFVLVSYATYIWAHNHRYLLGSGDRTRVGRVSCFKIKLPCPAALTDLQNWVQLWSQLSLYSTYRNVWYIFASALTSWLKWCVIDFWISSIFWVMTIFVIEFSFAGLQCYQISSILIMVKVWLKWSKWL